MRFRLHLAYNGTRFSGWQKQPNAITVQETIEQAISKLFNESIEIVGCGRTDAGVHATQYFAHFDTEKEMDSIAYKLNRMLPKDIVIHEATLVQEQFHARFDAKNRSYIYRLIGEKDPFRNEWVTVISKFQQLDIPKMQEAAKLLLSYQDFFPFCKTGGDNFTTICHLTQSEWEVTPNGELLYHISANRFLRGMVRLIVGMCINVGLGKVHLDEVRNALETKTRLTKSLSARANGLALCKVEYP